MEAAAKSIGFDFHGIDAPKNETSHYGLRYAEFVVPLVKAVQEQEAEINSNKLKIAQLEEENLKLKSKLQNILERLEKLESE